MKSLSLYAISEELAPLEASLENSGGEITDGNRAIVQRLEELQLMSQDKIDAYGAYYKNLESLAKIIKDEEDRLASRRQAIENRMQRLKDAAKEAMEFRGVVKIEGKTFSVSVQKNGGKAPIKLKVDPSKLPMKYTKPVPDMDRIRKELEMGYEPAKAIAEFEDVGTHLRIR